MSSLGTVNRTVVPAVTACLLLTACAQAPAGSTVPTQEASQPGTVTCDYRVTSKPAKRVDPPSTTNVPATGTASVTLNFAGGPVQITMDRAAAPCTVHSFESLAQQGYYNDTKCHRMGTQQVYFLQCGDPLGSGTGTPGYSFNDELAKTTGYPKGTVAMANAGKNTNGGQFFIVFGDSPFPPNYTAFGTVDDKGLAVVAAIAAQGTDNSQSAGMGRPLGDATIKSTSLG